jgi:SAM-dependent methyltransferase
MLRATRFVGSFLLMVAVITGGACWLQGAAGGGKTVKMKLLLPANENLYKSAIIKVDGKEIAGDGDERTIMATTAKDKDYVQVVVIFEPNNYTTITRPRKVVAKDDEVVVDFRKKSDKELDEIVVKFIPTPQDFVNAMCKLAKITKNDVVYDLGCGDGRMVITAVKKFGAKRGVGVDIDEKLVKECKESAKNAGVDDKVQFRVGDVLKVEDLSDATVVLLYMGDDINLRLKPILQKTLKPGSRVVSHRFLMGDDWKPHRTETVNSPEGGHCDIHLWEIKKK